MRYNHHTPDPITRSITEPISKNQTYPNQTKSKTMSTPPPDPVSHSLTATVYSLLKNPIGTVATTLAVLHAKPGAWAVLAVSGKRIFFEAMRDRAIGEPEFFARLHLWAAIGAELDRLGMLDSPPPPPSTPPPPPLSPLPDLPPPCDGAGAAAVRGTTVPSEARLLVLDGLVFVVDHTDVVRFVRVGEEIGRASCRERV